jgi:hypothetical protein
MKEKNAGKKIKKNKPFDVPSYKKRPKKNKRYLPNSDKSFHNFIKTFNKKKKLTI